MQRSPLSLLIILLLSVGSGSAAAQELLDLSGSWHLTSRLAATSVNLPGSLLTNGLGDDITPTTRWTGSLYDSSYYFNPFMEPYRRPGNMSFPFFLTPRKHFVGEVTYSRTVAIPKSWRRQQVTLFLERPHIETTVVVNGHAVGHQMSLSVPHQYDITPYLRFGHDNEITIRVYNGIENVCVGQDSHSVTDQTQGNWNGIAGRIELRTTPYIYKQRVITDLDSQIAHITINEQSFLVHVPGAKPWNEHSPQLYTATVVYHGQPVRVTFGFREVAVRGRDILLNGRPIHLRGTVENCCFPETGFPPTDTASWERIFRICKDFGLNHMRFHSYCPPEAAFVAADRLGFYLQPEGPSWPNHGVKLGNGMPIDKYLADECRAILDRYGHHPSFIMLAAGNEPAGNWVKWGADFVQEMKAYDPSRIYCTASVGGGWEWDYGSEYHVKGGARGLEWNRRQPSSDDDFAEQIAKPRNYRPAPTRQGNQASGQGKDVIAQQLPSQNGEGVASPGVLISHEQGQWCAFPDFKEIPQYTGAYKAANFQIFRDLLAAHGMAGQAEKFLMASGRLQVLAYKYEIERHLRTPGYAGFQLLALNDYSGQGTALVGPLNVHWREKGYCTAADWREFCSDLVPLAHFPRFTFQTTDTLRIPVTLYDATPSPSLSPAPSLSPSPSPSSSSLSSSSPSSLSSSSSPSSFLSSSSTSLSSSTSSSSLSSSSPSLSPAPSLSPSPSSSLSLSPSPCPQAVGCPAYSRGAPSVPRSLSYTITLGSAVLQQGTCSPGDIITFLPSALDRASKLTLTLTADATHRNHWDFWVYPSFPSASSPSFIICDLSSSKVSAPSLTGRAGVGSVLEALEAGKDVLLLAGGQIKYGNDVVHRFLPVFWNTSWFKMKPPHTTGALIQADHPLFRDFPTDDWQDLQWWELTNRAQCINLAEFPMDYQPIVQPIDTWHLSRKLGMLLEARVGKGRLILTTFDLSSDLDRRIVARQLRYSILRYMQSSDFNPTLNLSPDVLHHLFEREAPPVDMFTNESPDELKPKFSNQN